MTANVSNVSCYHLSRSEAEKDRYFEAIKMN